MSNRTKAEKISVIAQTIGAMLKALTISIVLAILCRNVLSQIPEPTFECISRITEPAGLGFAIAHSNPQLSEFCQNSEKICFTGMWVMYTEPNFGGHDGIGTAYPINGHGQKDCATQSVGAIMRQIKSIKAINYPPAMPTFENWAEFHTSAYFLGKSEQLDLAGTAAIPPPTGFENALSVAFYLQSTHVLACNSTDETATDAFCVCFNGFNSRSYMVPDLRIYPAENPLNTIAQMKPTLGCGAWTDAPVLKYVPDGLSLRRP